ncbi:hypothetical protein AB0D49_29390 [Streptomyces sp. NPDC048290]|uniref:hypothetical protein n=1 Tax=Streptomyces sp. NPDC048290 TaxID=3155811 RepID=UPI003443EBDA
MRRTPLLVGLVTAACLALTACETGLEDDGDGGDTKPSPSASHPLPSPSPSPTSTSSPTPSASAASGVGDLGEPARTVGAGTIGILEITPTTVVYGAQGGGVAPQNGVFAVVVLTETSLSANPADEEPAPGGGWQWVGADGSVVAAGGGSAGQVSLDGYPASGAIQPDDTAVRARVFDLTPAQAKGGRLVYTDGTEAEHEWELPGTDTGPEVADVKAKLGG